MTRDIINQSLAVFIDKHFINPPDRLEVSTAITAILLKIPLVDKNIKINEKE